MSIEATVRTTPAVSPTRRHRRGPVRREQMWTGYALVLIPMLLFTIFAVVPMFYAFYLGGTKYNIIKPPDWIGLKNFLDLTRDKIFWQAMVNTAIYSLGTVPLDLALALLIATFLNQKLRGIILFRTAFYLPVVTSIIAASVVWLWIFAPNTGLLNLAISKLGLPPQKWLVDPKLALPSVMFMSIWKGVGYQMVIYLAALQNVPVHLYEAAEVDGASAWAKFWRITLPLLKPTTFFLFVVSVIGSFQVFGAIFVMTNGGPGYATTTLVHQIYQNGFKFLKMGYGAAESLVLFLVIFVLSMINWFFLRSDVEYW